jgi:hypothetical protein
MALTKFGVKVNVISDLADTPVMPSSELKAQFDLAGVAIKNYINDTLTTQIDESLQSLEDKTEKIPAVVDALDSVDTKAALSAAQGRLLDQTKQNKILFGTDEPSGGNDGDIYIQY